jgi:hypothetical protein
VYSGEASGLAQYKQLHRQKWRLGKKFEKGGHGEIWRAYKVRQST